MGGALLEGPDIAVMEGEVVEETEVYVCDRHPIRHRDVECSTTMACFVDG